MPVLRFSIPSRRMRSGFAQALRRATAIAATSALIYMPILSYAPVAHATDYTGGNGGDGSNGTYGGGLDQPGHGGGGGANGNGGAAQSGGDGGGGGGGGAADSAGSGGQSYYYGAGGGGGGAGGAGFILSDGNAFTSSGVVTGGNGGNGNQGIAAVQSGIGGGGGGGGGGSGIVVLGSGTITNSNDITGGTGGYGGATNYLNVSNPHQDGQHGAGGRGINAAGSTGLTIDNNGNITGGNAGDGLATYAVPNIGGAGIYGQNITLNNTGGTIKGGLGDVVSASGIELIGGTNVLNISGGTIASGYPGDGTYAIKISGGTNTINVTGGTVGNIYLGGGTNTLEGSGFSDIVTLAGGATGQITAAGGDVSGITTFDNYGGLTIDTSRALTVSTFTNENGGTLTLNSGAQLIASTLNLLDGSTIAGAGTLSNGVDPLTLSGGSISATVGGTGGLVKSGTGTLTLTGANTYTGGTTVNGGTLSIADGALGAGDVTLAEGTTIQFTGSSFTTTNDFHITGDPVFEVAAGTTQTVSGIIDDATGPTNPGVVEKTGPGTLILSGANTYSGGTTIQQGILQIGTDSVFNTPGDPTSGIVSSAIGTGTLTFEGATLQAGVDTIIANAIDMSFGTGEIDANGHLVSLAGLISGTGGELLITGSSGGIVTFANAGNSFSSGIEVDPGLRVSESANGDFGSGLVRLTDGSGINFTGADTYTNAVDVSGNTTFDLGGKAVTYNGLIADVPFDHGAVTVTGGGTLTLTNGANSYTGGTFISGGSTVSIDADGEFGGTAGGVTLGDATTTGTLAVTQNVTSARTITLDAGGGIISAPFGKTLTLSGQVTGNGGLTVSGPGGLFLTGNTNNYSGGTTIASGVVTAGRTNVLGTGSLAIKAAGLLDLNNRSQSITSLTDGGDVHGGTIGNSGGGAAVLTIGSDNSDSAFSGVIEGGSGAVSLVKTGTGTLTLSGANTYSGGTTLSAGTLRIGTDTVFNTPGDATSGIVSSAIGTGTLTLDGGTLTVATSVYPTLTNDIVLGPNSGTIDIDYNSAQGLELAGNITGNTGITITDTTSPWAFGDVTLGGNNTYSGTTTLSSAYITLASDTGLSANSDYVLDTTNSGISLKGHSGTIRSLSGVGTVDNEGTSVGILTIAPASGGSHSFAGYLTNDPFNNTPGYLPLALVLDGAQDGVQILSGANDYTGSTTITSGILGVGSDTALGTGTVTLDGGTLQMEGNFSLGNDITVDARGGTFDTNGYDAELTGTLSSGSTDGALTIIGNGSVKISGMDNLSGGAVIGSGATVEAAGASGLGAGNIAMADTSSIHFTTTSGTFTNHILLDGTASFDVDSGLTTTLNNMIADAPSAGSPGVLEKTGAGTLVLAGANTYSGGTTLTEGTLRVGADTIFNTPGDVGSGIAASALGTGTLTFNGGTLQAGGDDTIANAIDLNSADGVVDTNGRQFSLIGTITGSHGLTIIDSQGDGAVTMAANNSYSGGTTVDGATVILAGGSSGPSSGVMGAGTITLNGGTLQAGASGFLLNDIALDTNGGTLRAGNNNYAFGTISDSGGTPGALTIGAADDTGTVVLAASNTYTGGTTIAGGAARAQGSGSFGTGDITINDGATLQYDDAIDIANNIALAGNGKLDVENSDSATQSGNISDAAGVHGGFEKTGTGTLLLTGTNSYSGATKISAGTLEVAGPDAVSGVSSYEVDSDGTFAVDGGLVGGNNSFVDIGRLADGPNGGGTVTVASNTTLRVGHSDQNDVDATFSGTLSGYMLQYSASSRLTLTGSSSLEFLTSYSHGAAGGLTLSGGTWGVNTDLSAQAGVFRITNGATVDAKQFDQTGDDFFNLDSKVIIDGGSNITVGQLSGGGGLNVMSMSGAGVAFTVEGGSHITAADHFLVAANDASYSVPTATITGAGTTLNTPTVYVGSANGGGVLTVSDGASLGASQITIDNGGQLVLDHGNLTPYGSAKVLVSSDDASTAPGGKLVVTANENFGPAIQITGNLALEVQAGNFVLTDSGNDYHGLTTIDSGATLTVGVGTSDGALGTAAVTDNGTLVFNNLSATTLPHVVGGNGGLTQKGPGTLNVAVQQNYTGVTSIADGSTLALTGTASIFSSSEVANAGTFDISGLTNGGTSIKTLSGDGTVQLGGNTLTIVNGSTIFTGTIDDGGAGGSVDIAGGNQVLSGTNNWSGTTTVQAGTTLTVASPESIGGSMIKFYDGSVIKFLSGGVYTPDAEFAQQQAPVYDTNGNTVTWAGKLTGVGDLAVTGGGTLILTNSANDYHGGTEVYGDAVLNIGADGELGAVAPLQLGDATTRGTLQYGASFALDMARAVTLNAGGGAIDTNGFNATIAQAIGGTGGLAKLGAGTLTLTGTSAYTGATTVNGGVLQVNGSIASSAVTVASGGTLGGSGTVGATSVSAGGAIAPNGNTLHVSGAIAIANGATTAIAVAPATSGKIAATGSASLDGTLAITQGAGTYTAGSSFQLISASSVAGTFDSVTGASFTGLDSNIVYSATGVELDLTTPASGGGSGGGSGSGGGVTTKFLFDTYGKTSNQIAVGKALAAGDPTGALYGAMGGIVKADVQAVPAALGQLSGDIHASIRSAMVEDSRTIRDTVLDHVQFAEQGTAMWGAGFYSNGGIDSDGNASALHHNSTGFLAGVDMPFAEGFRAGIGGGYVSNGASEPGRASTARGSSGHLLAYAGWSDGALTLKLGGDYGWGDVDVTRHVSALSETNTNSEHQRIAQLFGEAAYTFQTDTAAIEPYGDLAHVSARTGAFAEKGGLSALSGDSKDEDATYATLGVRVSLADVKLGDTSIVPKLGIGWQHAFDRFAPDQVLTLQNAVQNFTVQGVPLRPDSAIVQAGIGFMLSPDVVLDVVYDGAFAASAHNHGVRGALRWSF